MWVVFQRNDNSQSRHLFLLKLLSLSLVIRVCLPLPLHNSCCHYFIHTMDHFQTSIWVPPWSSTASHFNVPLIFSGIHFLPINPSFLSGVWRTMAHFAWLMVRIQVQEHWTPVSFPPNPSPLLGYSYPSSFPLRPRVLTPVSSSWCWQRVSSLHAGKGEARY